MIQHTKTPTSLSCMAGYTQSHTPLIISLLLIFAAYVLLCSKLCFRRRDAMHRKFNFPNKASLAHMTSMDAHAITKYVAELEFPQLYRLSVEMGIFKTYGIPSLTKLLCRTNQLSSRSTGDRRTIDTALLIRQFSINPPTSDRTINAIARVNYLHTPYFKDGSLKNEDMLFTLSMFVLEPVRWMENYEWRAFTDMERCALATQWKWIGEALVIKYEGYLACSKWKDGLEWYDDLKAWSEAYEKSSMCPAATNKKVADQLIRLLVFYIPQCLRLPAINMVFILMGERLRTALCYSTPPRYYSYLVTVFLQTRRFLVRYLALPRPSTWNVRNHTDGPNRYFLNSYLVDPFYTPPTYWNRWGPHSWWVRLMGGVVPGADKSFEPAGWDENYLSVGPQYKRGKGGEKVIAEAERLKEVIPLGCPFSIEI